MFGFSFLNSLFLWGLAAAALPVIIHLIKRNRAVKLPFAAIRFLQLEPNERFRSQRLKQFILLALRMLALAILAFAFARPFWADKQTVPFWGDEPEASVIMIDNSYSLAADNRLSDAVEKAKDLLRASRPRDQITVMQFGETTEVIGESEGQATALAGQLGDRVRLSYQSTNYMQALQTAESALIESQRALKTVHVISDFQKSGWDNLNPHWSILDGIKLDFIEVGEGTPPENAAIQDLHLNREDGSKSAEVLVRIKNFALTRRKITTILSLNNKRISQRALTFEPSEEKTVEFRRAPLSGAYVTGKVELEVDDDALEMDNSFYFVVENETQSQILAVNGEPNRDAVSDELFFFERALNLPGHTKYLLTQVQQSGLEGYDFNNYRALVLANIKELPRSLVERLTFYVRGGGGLVITLGDRVSPNIYNRLFQDLSPATLTNRAFQTIDRNSGVVLGEVDYTHPIFRLFSDPGQGDPGIAEFYQYFHAESLSPESVLARYDDGSPALIERKVGAGKVVLLTSTIDTEWNNLPVKALYLPLLYQTLQYVASERKGRESLLVGNPLTLQSQTTGQTGDAKFTVLTPAGETVDAEGFLFENTTEPGIYKVSGTSRRNPDAYFAVNLDVRESDLTAVSDNDLQARIGQISRTAQTASIVNEQFIDQAEKNQKLWRFAILLVLLILVGETWLGNRTYR